MLRRQRHPRQVRVKPLTAIARSNDKADNAPDRQAIQKLNRLGSHETLEVRTWAYGAACGNAIDVRQDPGGTVLFAHLAKPHRSRFSTQNAVLSVRKAISQAPAGLRTALLGGEHGAEIVESIKVAGWVSTMFVFSTRVEGRGYGG